MNLPFQLFQWNSISFLKLRYWQPIAWLHKLPEWWPSVRILLRLFFISRRIFLKSARRKITKPDETIGSSLWIFSALCDYFSKFFCLQKVRLQIFLIFYCNLEFQKAQRVSLLKLSALWYCFSFLVWNCVLSIYTHKSFFSKFLRNFDVISGVKRYIRISDAVSELYCVLLRRRRRLENRSFSWKCTHIFKTALFER